MERREGIRSLTAAQDDLAAQEPWAATARSSLFGTWRVAGPVFSEFVVVKHLLTDRSRKSFQTGKQSRKTEVHTFQIASKLNSASVIQF